MAVTLLNNLLPVEVFTDSVTQKLGDAIRFANSNMVYLQNFEGQPSATITVPKMAYIGDAVVTAENTAVDPTLLTSASDTLDVIKLAKAVSLTQEAINGSFGNPIVEAESQIVRSIANAVEAQLMTALGTATLIYDTEAGANLDGNNVINALSLFGEEQDGEKTLILNPLDLASVRTDGNYDSGRNQMFDMNVVVSNRVAENSAYIAKAQSLGAYISRDVSVMYDDDVLSFVHVISAFMLGAFHLRDESKAIRINLTAGV